MAVRSRMMLTGVAVLAAVGAFSACGGGGSTPSGTTAAVVTPTAPVPSGTSGPSGPSGVNVTESNPVGDIPDSQAFVGYTPTRGGYTARVPEGWARTDTGTGALFSDKYNSIRADGTAAPAAPTVRSGRAEVAAIRAAAQGFTAGDVTTVQRPAGPAVLITYRADSPPSEVTGKVVSRAVERYEFWRNGKTVVLTLSAPVGSDNVDPWRTVTDSFRWTA